MTEEPQRRQRMLLWLMLAVALWGGMLALGALLFSYDPATGQVELAPRLLRGGIVLLCVGAFLAGWGVLAWRRFR